MSTLPPPIPSSDPTRRFGSMQPPTIGGLNNSRKQTFNAEDLKKASPLPLIIGIFSLIASLIVIFLNDDSVVLSALGYALTPFLSIAALGFDTVWQRRKTTQFPWYVANPNFSRALRVIAGISIVLSYPHIHGLASHLSAWLADVFPGLAS